MIEATAPVRICDIGGWTDTWFGGPGRVVNIAVVPGITVTVGRAPGPDRVVLDVGTTGDRYTIVPGAARPARHALLEAAVDTFPPPHDAAVEITVRSTVPPGCGAGTSAAVAVALVGALVAAGGERRAAREVAAAAHRLEVDVLGNESGVQDQLSAAYGGINYLEIDTYPDAVVRPLPHWDELASRLTLVYLGRAHDSSAVHREVIDRVGRSGPEVLAPLRAAAVAARDAVVARDLHGFGRAMIANTDGQRALHPELVGRDAARVIDHARALDAIGWKVNGAGGDGGSVTILSTDRDAKDALETSMTDVDPRYEVLPIDLTSSGLAVRGGLE